MSRRYFVLSPDGTKQFDDVDGNRLTSETASDLCEGLNYEQREEDARIELSGRGRPNSSPFCWGWDE